ncbi:hypothetical protein GWK47_018333 [Chionoecetes opilio]|uniref:Uncharacterized protein n=1 Tax=Chionoecetes opilio TaxID=41210 RepID=A0A8J5CJF8_CHIOP|nr:hypothetical protein GWK47_018333 [Chionoecetes opilio]
MSSISRASSSSRPSRLYTDVALASWLVEPSAMLSAWASVFCCSLGPLHRLGPGTPGRRLPLLQSPMVVDKESSRRACLRRSSSFLLPLGGQGADLRLKGLVGPPQAPCPAPHSLQSLVLGSGLLLPLSKGGHQLLVLSAAQPAAP